MPLTPPGPLADSFRKALVLQKGIYNYVVHPLLDGVPRCPPELLKEWVDWARLQRPTAAATLLLAPEAMGLPLVAALSLATGLPYAIVRKRAYGLPGERTVAATTGYGEATFHLNDLRTGDRVLVIDDVLSTGSTLAAIFDGVQATGASLAGALLVVDKGTARDGLARRYNVPVLAAATVSVTAKGVEIL